MSTPPPQPLDGTTLTIKKNGLCQVCGDDASIINYGALVCSSCRTFFRRNGYHKKGIIPCQLDGNCEVTKLTRRLCTACRFAKCLAVGMSRELIRKADLTVVKRKSKKSHHQEIQTVMTIPQASALDLPRGDSGSHLNSRDWTMISNVVHAFERFSPVMEIRRVIEQINTSAPSQQYDLSRSIQMIGSFSTALQLFISSTPDFKVLTTSEQCSLFQRNMLGLLSIGGIYLMRESGMFDKPENEIAVLPLYGNEIVQKTKMISTQLDVDPTIIKLLLVALAFSSNSFINHNQGHIDKDSLLFGTYRLFGSQNVYVELIWKYLIHRYSYNESVQRFSILIKRLLDTLKLSVEIYENNQIFQTFIDDIIRHIEQSPIINAKTIIPLWGRH